MSAGLDADPPRVVALSGGVGGAKLALGLSDYLGIGGLGIIANTGDDFEHFGLLVCPDIDTLIYTLAGRSNPTQGWGVEGESWAFMDEVRRRGLPDWFQLGDRDLLTHVRRGALLKDGHSLSETTAILAKDLGVVVPIASMSDMPVRTFLETSEGRLAFQDYFVRRKCTPVVKEVVFEGAAQARLSPAAEVMIAGASDAIIICPSNPFVSIGPILSVPGCVEALSAAKAPIVAVSPIVGGDAIKGPSAKMMRELGLDVSCIGALDVLNDSLDGALSGYVIDQVDAASMSNAAARLPVTCVNTVMRDRADKFALAQDVLDFVGTLQ